MVKTRKRPDVDVSPGNDFVSLRGRSSKRGVHSESEENGEISSGDDITPQSKRQRVTVRGRASHSLNSTPADYPQRSLSRHLDETPIGVSSMSPRRTRSTDVKKSGKKYANHNSYRADDEDEEEDEDDEIPRSPRSKRAPAKFRDNKDEMTSTRKGRARQLQEEEDDDEKDEEEEETEDDEVQITPKARKRMGQLSKAMGRRDRKRLKEDAEPLISDQDEHEDPDFQVAPRRSTRERKVIYSTMNQSLIGNCYSTDLLLSGGADVSPPVSSSRRKQAQAKKKEEEEDDDDNEDDDDEEETGSKKSERSGIDMYSRIKNRRISEKKAEEERRKLQKEAEEEEDSEEESDSDDSDDSDDDTTSSEEESSEGEQQRKNYSLRRQRRPPDRFEATIEEPIPRNHLKDSLFDQALSPLRRRFNARTNYDSPVRSPRFSRTQSRKHTTHHSSSTSSDSDDERKFERRKKKSMAKARMRCLPMNMNQEEVAGGVIRDRQRIGSSLADVDPMNIDSNATFDSVGGLGQHLQSLKEMIVFPLLYPEVFERFKITPPRGVLFHGPPGTGKTLVARALANECRQGEKRVAFFMRKGADCLSKWVGESERQLRLLFDQAFQMRPSIIFFDEIDGLAPVRSSRQDQIHSSIVSTLLALMDGLDSCGEIVIIGATNRIDSIDPALRRPGRFDREFLFPLPSASARTSILSIHTKEWSPKLSETFISEVAEKCVGYCGADIKALCTEAGLSALRHQYPQIYASKEKLQLDLSCIQVSARDFQHAMQTILPAAQRAVISPGRSLSFVIKPLLQNQFNSALEVIKRLIPTALYSTSKLEGPGNSAANNMVMDMLNEDDFSEEEEDAPSIFVSQPTKGSGPRRRILSGGDGAGTSGSSGPILNFTCAAYNKPSTYRPRLLIVGNQGQGQSSHLAPAILHHLERLPVHCLDLAALYAVSAKSPEESCAQVFREAQRTSPSIIYMPHLRAWWDATGETARATFLTLLQDLPPTIPVLVLATSDTTLRDLPIELQVIFGSYYGEVITMRQPNEEERREFFSDLILVQAAKAPVKKKRAAQVALQVLEVAPPPEPRKLSQDEEKSLQDKEDRTLRELRLFLRDVLSRLATEKKFRVFAKPVDPEEVPDYTDVVRNPMDLSTMMNKINMHKYTKARQFLDDIDLITSNALEYNPDRHPEDRIIRNRACELKDSAYAIVQTEMDSEFEKLCGEIEESRGRRGSSPTKTAPSFYRVLPKHMAAGRTTELAQTFDAYPTRFSRRALGMESEQLSAAEEAMLYASCRPTTQRKPKSKKRKLKSRWSRGFVPKPNTKKKTKPEEEADEKEDGDEDSQKNESVAEDEDKENGAQDVVENGVLEDEKNEDEAMDVGDKDKNTVQENCIDDKPDGESAMLNNHCSDNESVKSGEVVRETRSARRSGGERSSRRSSQSSPPPVSSNRTSPAAAGHTLSTGRRSRGSSPRVLQVAASSGAFQVNHVHVEQIESEKSAEVAETNENSNSGVSEDPPTSSLDPPSSVDNDTAQEKKDRNEEEMDTEEAGGDNNGEEKKDDEEKKESPIQKRVTRRMAEEKEAERAREILEASLPKLVVDKKRLETLLDSIVEKTYSFNIERLERLHASLSQCIYQHRRDYDKTQLIQDMEIKVSRVTTV